MSINNQILQGIWLDQKMAIIVTLSEGKSKVKKVLSKVEEYHPSGGARSKTPWGPRDVISESTYLNRKKHQLKQYYFSIISEIKEASDLLILGPAETKTGLLKTVQNSKGLNFNRVVSRSSEKLTDNQLISQIREHFQN